MIVDLFPNAIQSKWTNLEAACELIEAAGDEFSLPSLWKLQYSVRIWPQYGSLKRAVKAMEAEGIIERITPRSSVPREVFYRKINRALIRQREAYETYRENLIAAFVLDVLAA